MLAFTRWIGLTFSGLCLLLSPALAEPPNLSLLKHTIRNYHDSGAYEKELTAVIDKANKVLQQHVPLHANAPKGFKPAMVLDIDETSLSNYDDINRLDFTGNPKVIHRSILRAKAPALAPMLALYRRAQAQGVTVFFISGRRQTERTATIHNLHNAGYRGWKTLFLRPNNDTRTSVAPFKTNARKYIEQQGYTILLNLGDQCSDLKGGHAKYAFKLPNPYYFLP